MKKGFTLIELLAVIVILAIIAIIATPIVLNIISDSKKSASLRSAEFYLDAVELSIANSTLNNKKITAGTYSIMEDGNICIGTLTDDTCDGDILEVEVKGDKPTSGEVIIEGIEVKTGTTLNFSGYTATVNADNKVEIGDAVVVEPTPVCTYANEGTEGQPGSKYNCNVDGTNTFSFHILSVNGASADLLLDNNICENGTLATNYSCNVKYSLYNMSETGPTTAMTHLYNATKNWSNIPKIESYTYNDNGYIDEYYNDFKYGYDSYEINSGVVQITDLQNSVVLTLGTNELPVRARIASLSDFTNHCSNTSYSEYSGCASWLFNGLDPANTVNGYWLLNASNGGASEIAPRYVASYSDLKIGYHYIDNPTDMGVRPVITIPTGLLG